MFGVLWRSRYVVVGSCLEAANKNERLSLGGVYGVIEVWAGFRDFAFRTCASDLKVLDAEHGGISVRKLGLSKLSANGHSPFVEALLVLLLLVNRSPALESK